MYAVEERTSGRLEDAELAPLVERACAREDDAFEELVRRMQGPVRAFCRRILGDAALGDDAAQETFVRIWNGLSRYRSQGRFVSWSFTIARNTAIELLRKEKRAPVPSDEIPVHTTDPMGDAVLRRVVGNAIRELPEPYRTTFLYREAGLSYDEIAEAQACPIGTIRSRLHQARRLLAERLDPILHGGDA